MVLERHIGFTGTREGMNESQKESLRRLLSHAIENDEVVVLHHGDCVGADAEAHDIAVDLGCSIVIHPPIVERYRAWKSEDSRNVAFVREPENYVSRDHRIVDATKFLIAAPKRDVEELRSGTWLTVRYARKCKKTVARLLREPTETSGLYWEFNFK